MNGIITTVAGSAIRNSPLLAGSGVVAAGGASSDRTVGGRFIGLAT
jgi:hypothetical protein